MLKGSRRQFIRWATLAVLALLVAAFRSLAERLAALQPRSRRVVVPADLPQDVVFVDDVIVCRTDNGVRALSARCTHLGCTLTSRSGDMLVCPCHGSRFHLDGSVARGPASRALEVLPHRVDRAAGTIVVQGS